MAGGTPPKFPREPWHAYNQRMDGNPYKAPMRPAEPVKLRAVPGGTDWPALAGLFVGALAAVLVGNSLNRSGATNGYVLGVVLCIVGSTTIVAWWIGRLLGLCRAKNRPSS